MPDFRQITTASSEWLFNTSHSMYRRRPLREGEAGAVVPYVDAWEPYEDIIELPEEGSVIVVRPVPWGSGQLRQTGRIITDRYGTYDYRFGFIPDP